MEPGQPPSLAIQNVYCNLEASFELAKTQNRVHHYNNISKRSPDFQVRFCQSSPDTQILTLVINRTAYSFTIKKDELGTYYCKENVKRTLQKAPVRVEYIEQTNELFYLADQENRIMKCIPDKKEEEVVNFRSGCCSNSPIVEGIIDFDINPNGHFVVADQQHRQYYYSYLERKKVKQLLVTEAGLVTLQQLCQIEWAEEQLLFSFLIRQRYLFEKIWCEGQGLGFRFQTQHQGFLRYPYQREEVSRSIQEFYNQGKKILLSTQKKEISSLVEYLKESEEFFERHWFSEMQQFGCSERMIEDYIEIFHVEKGFLLLSRDQIVFQPGDLKEQPIVLFQNFYEGMEFMKIHEKLGMVYVLARKDKMLHLLLFSIDWSCQVPFDTSKV